MASLSIQPGRILSPEFRILLHNEARIRLRRGSTAVVLLVAALLMWAMVVDPASGYAMLAANGARVANTTTALALGSSVLASTLIGLFGFYLLRGRAAADLRLGTGAVLAATPTSNWTLLLARWAAGVLYLAMLVATLCATMLVLQAVRGEGALQPLVLVQFTTLAHLPNLCFVAAMAVLWDATPSLMGKAGDVLYFFVWLAQIGAVSAYVASHAELTLLMVVDPTGVGMLIQRGQQVLHTSSLAVGLNAFDPALPAVFMTSGFWTWPMILQRCMSGALALLPLALAAARFHRYSPDRVQASAVRPSWAIGEAINRVFRPFDLVSPFLLWLAPRLPRPAAALLAEIALTLAARPLAGPLLVCVVVMGAMVDAASLPWLVLATVACWGILISDVCVRDASTGVDQLTQAVTGGASLRHLRQCAAVMLLGVAMTAPVLLRWCGTAPLHALCLAAGLLTLTGLAQCLGGVTRTGRVFLVLLLCGLYLTAQMSTSVQMPATSRIQAYSASHLNGLKM